MNKDQRYSALQALLNTSVEDCRQTLQRYHDATLLCDLLIACHQKGHTSREKAVRARIAQLMRG